MALNPNTPTQTTEGQEQRYLKQKYFTYFVDTKDVITNPSKNYRQRITPKTCTITMGKANEYIYSGSVSNYSGTFVTAFSGSKADDPNLYSVVASLLRNDKKDMNSDWYPISGRKCTHFAVYSFANNVIGDGLYAGQFEISIDSDDYKVREVVSGDKFDIAYRWRSQTSNFGVVQKGDTDVGLFFGELGLVFFYNNGQTNVPSVAETITTTDLQREQMLNSETYFCRVTHERYNASRNESWRKWSDDLRAYIVDKDYTVITSIGLYDDDNTLMAIGKLSQPIIKQRDSEALFSLVLQY